MINHNLLLLLLLLFFIFFLNFFREDCEDFIKVKQLYQPEKWGKLMVEHLSSTQYYINYQPNQTMNNFITFPLSVRVKQLRIKPRKNLRILNQNTIWCHIPWLVSQSFHNQLNLLPQQLDLCQFLSQTEALELLPKLQSPRVCKLEETIGIQTWWVSHNDCI